MKQTRSVSYANQALVRTDFVTASLEPKLFALCSLIHFIHLHPGFALPYLVFGFVQKEHSLSSASAHFNR